MAEYQTNLQIDSERLWAFIHETAEFGASEGWGEAADARNGRQASARLVLCRLPRCRLRGAYRRLGFDLRRSPGPRPLKAANRHRLAFGHAPTGSKYDGVLGTLAALEVIHTLNRLDID